MASLGRSLERFRAFVQGLPSSQSLDLPDLLLAVLNLDDALSHGFEFRDSARNTAPAAGTSLHTYTIPLDGLYEVDASGHAVEAQTAPITLRLAVFDESGTGMWEQRIVVSAAGSGREWKGYRFWLRRNWVVRVQNEQTVAAAQNVDTCLNVRRRMVG